MINIEKPNIVGFEEAIRGMRNPKNSWDRSDSNYELRSSEDGNDIFKIGPNDYGLMKRLASGGPVHAKYRRMIVVYADVTAPLYWWKEFDTYKVGTVANSCSTMHKLTHKKFEPDDISHDYLIQPDSKAYEMFLQNIDVLNYYRDLYLAAKDEEYKKLLWKQMIQLLPSAYNQKRTIMLNYEVLTDIYHSRRTHKLDEWHTFCDWIKSLPYSDLITGEEE